jgi:hypothetical protein
MISKMQGHLVQFPFESDGIFIGSPGNGQPDRVSRFRQVNHQPAMGGKESEKEARHHEETTDPDQGYPWIPVHLKACEIGFLDLL